MRIQSLAQEHFWSDTYTQSGGLLYESSRAYPLSHAAPNNDLGISMLKVFHPFYTFKLGLADIL